MHRCGSGFLLTLAIIFVVALTGCLGKSSSNPGNGGVASITLSPGSSNLPRGRSALRSLAPPPRMPPADAVLGVDIQFIVASGNPNVPHPRRSRSPAMASACAGTWDPSRHPVQSRHSRNRPRNRGQPTASAARPLPSTSTSTSTAFRLAASTPRARRLSTTASPRDKPGCIEAHRLQQRGVDITNTVGPMSWSSSNTGVVTATPYTPPDQPNVLNQVQTTAKAPGITQLFATVSGTTSSP